MRRYAFEHVKNLRDLGGYPAAGGKATKFGRFLRSDAPMQMSEGELNTLRGMDITTIIDLRAAEEVDRSPYAFDGAAGFHCHHLPAYLGGGVACCAEDIPGMYFSIASDPQSMHGIMKAIADASGGVLYHCSAGKDRTGIVSALLLSLVGVAQVDILADYQVSYTYLAEWIERMRRSVEDLPMYMMRSNVEYMEGFLDRMKAAYGSVEHYLDWIGLTGTDMNRLREKLVG